MATMLDTLKRLSRPGVAFFSLALLVFLLQPLPLDELATEVDSRGCRTDPLSGLEANRWTVIDPCVTLGGTVGTADFPSSANAYWIMLRLDATSMSSVPGLQTFGEPQVWAKFYPDLFPNVPRPRENEQVKATGALVYDSAYGWQELVPVWSVQVSNLAATVAPVRLMVDGMVNGDSVTYSVVVWNDSGLRLGPVYVAATRPSGGIAEWLAPSIQPGLYAGPFIYTSPATGDLTVNAYAHWTSPQEGSVTSPRIQPKVR